MLRTLSVGCVLACLAIAEAFACRGPDFERTIIFDDVPISLDAPVIVEVTINDMKDIVDSQRMRWAVINARVERVIKGPIHDGTLKVVAPVSDCTAGFDVGSH